MRKKLGKDHKFRWYIGLFKKTFMDGTLKPSVLNGQRLDVEFKMAVTLWAVSNWNNGRAGELKIYKVCTSKRFIMFLKYFI